MKPPLTAGPLVLLLATLGAALWLRRERLGGGKFPALVHPNAPLEVLDNRKIGIGGSPSRRLCLLEEELHARSAMQSLARRYPNGWSSASRFVDFAPTYIITTGSSQILVLKKGLVIEVGIRAGRAQRVAHRLVEGEAELIVRSMCRESR